MKPSITLLSVVAFSLAMSSTAMAAHNLIHVGGDCSTQWQSPGNGPLADPLGTYNMPDLVSFLYERDWPDGTVTGMGWGGDRSFQSIDAQIDNTKDLWTSVGELANVLNQYCNRDDVPSYSYTANRTVSICDHFACFGKFGCFCSASHNIQVPYTVTVPDNPPDDCVIFNYSGSDNIVRMLLSMYGDTWDTLAVYTTAGAGGGSELASEFDLGAVSASNAGRLSDNTTRTTCPFTTWLDVDSARNGYGEGWWSYDDTNGTPIYHWAGYVTNNSNSWMFPGSNDGAVAYHSALGRAYPNAYTFNIYGSEVVPDDPYDTSSPIDPDADNEYMGHYAWRSEDETGHWPMKWAALTEAAAVNCKFFNACGSGSNNSSLPFSNDACSQPIGDPGQFDCNPF
jgi:hypothetical protein